MTEISVCPICKNKFVKVDKPLKCTKNHCFDIAKQGYVNFLIGNGTGSGDDKEMCRSRHEFHNADYYGVLSKKLADICVKNGFKTIIDAGCGEGYYLRKIRDKYKALGMEFYSFLGIDLAKEAIAIGAKCEKNIEEIYKIKYAVAGIFDMPILSNVADCVLSVFAPIPAKEALRVLHKKGILISVSPGEKHLEGLKNVVYDNVYDNIVTAKSYDGFELQETLFAKDIITVTGENIANLFHMTPYYWKTSEKDSAKLEKYDKISTEIDFVINIYNKI